VSKKKAMAADIISSRKCFAEAVAREQQLVLDKTLLPNHLGDIGTKILSLTENKDGEGSIFFTHDGIMYYIDSIPFMNWHLVAGSSIQFFCLVDPMIAMVFVSIFLICAVIAVVFNMYVSKIYSELVLANEQADMASRAKSAFLARMSHEIRTPLGAVTGFCELAYRERGKPEAQEYLVGIKRAGESLLGIVNDILDFSKIEFGHLTINDSPYDTASLLNDVLTVIRFRITEKSLTLTTDIAPDIPGAMIGDAGSIRQILLNLLSNAVKYSAEGASIQLTVFGEKTAENAIRLTLSVEDSGIGIRQEELPKIFDDFTRLDEKRNSAIEGTGLGLPITRSLCRAMGGDIFVVSEYGKGSLFTATLMQSVDEWEPIKDLASPTYYQKAPMATFSAPKAEVLLVDDFPDNLRGAEGLLRPYRMRVYSCRNGLEAFDLVQSHKFDLVLMDHMMPVMDGVEATTHIRALGGRFAALPIVALTANAVGEMREFFLKHEFSDFISKPIVPATLDTILARWIPVEKQGPAALPEDTPESSTNITQESGPKQGFGMPGAAKATLAAQRLNLLDHYRWHFANDMPVDTANFERFCALVETMGVPPQMQGDMASLAAAGRRGDAAEIQQRLPGVYEALAHAMREGRKNGPSAQDEDAVNKLKDTLKRLKEALDKSDSQSAEAAMGELAAMDSLSDEANELYFFLNDALLMRQTEKAAGGLTVWVKNFDKLA